MKEEDIFMIDPRGDDFPKSSVNKINTSNLNNDFREEDKELFEKLIYENCVVKLFTVPTLIFNEAIQANLTKSQLRSLNKGK